MSGSAGGGDEMKAEPNLTPLLDVVFQLITFFMLLINFSNDNYDARVKLPIAGSARPMDESQVVSDDHLVLNIEKNGHLIAEGKSMYLTQAMDYIKKQSQLVTMNLKAVGQKPAKDGSLPTSIILRADRDASFDAVYSMINACQVHGFRKFALKAMSGS